MRNIVTKGLFVLIFFFRWNELEYFPKELLVE